MPKDGEDVVDRYRDNTVQVRIRQNEPDMKWHNLRVDETERTCWLITVYRVY